MRFNRQQILLMVLAVIGVVQIGDWVLGTMIQGPLQLRRAKTEQLQADITKREKSLAETRNSAKQIEGWLKQSLPANPEVTRSVYRSWLLSLIKTANLRNATVDSGSPSTRKAKDNKILFRSMPFSVRCRGSLAEFNAFLFQFSSAGHLHQITSLSLNPVAATGLFDISVGIESLLLADRKGDQLNTESSSLLASKDFGHYESIVKDNIFGVGLNTIDPRAHTIISAITFSDGVPQIWITEQLTNKTTQVGVGVDFNTAALSGRVVEVHDQDVIIETSGVRMLCPIGKPFSEAVLVTAPAVPSSP